MGWKKTYKECVNKHIIANGNCGSLAVESLRNYGELTLELFDEGNYPPTLLLLD